MCQVFTIYITGRFPSSIFFLGECKLGFSSALYFLIIYIKYTNQKDLMFILLIMYCVLQFFPSGVAAILSVHNILVVFYIFIYLGDKVYVVWNGVGLNWAYCSGSMIL